MNDRRSFLGMLAALFQFPQAKDMKEGHGDEGWMEQAHTWTKGPFYISISGQMGTSEPLLVEHCSVCGIMRLPKAWRATKGEIFNRLLESR